MHLNRGQLKITCYLLSFSQLEWQRPHRRQNKHGLGFYINKITATNVGKKKEKQQQSKMHDSSHMMLMYLRLYILLHNVSSTSDSVLPLNCHHISALIFAEVARDFVFHTNKSNAYLPRLIWHGLFSIIGIYLKSLCFSHCRSLHHSCSLSLALSFTVFVNNW